MANKLPHDFVARILADKKIPNPQGLLDALSSGNPSVAIRHNRLKGCQPPKGARTVPWCEQGEYLDQRPAFTFDPAFHQGLYYVQDPSSMAVGCVVEALGLSAPVVCLDACAAPGGKTTAVIDALPQGSFVVANEFEPARAMVLSDNLMKWGAPNVAVTIGPAQRLGRLPAESFDLIIADVPCSGEGMMRKDPKAVEQWTPGLVRQCAALQREIVSALWPLLRPGGHMVYSTCTFAEEEDEENVRFVVEELGAEEIALPAMPGVVNGHFYPHLVEGEGLYMALLRKPGEFIPQKEAKISEKQLAKATKLLRFGSEDYELKGRDKIPSHAMALRADFDFTGYSAVEVNRDEALRFLHRDTLTLPDGTPRGLTLLTYSNRPLGWVNNLGNRANNLLPKPLRIVSNLR